MLHIDTFIEKLKQVCTQKFGSEQREKNCNLCNGLYALLSLRWLVNDVLNA